MKINFSHEFSAQFLEAAKSVVDTPFNLQGRREAKGVSVDNRHAQVLEDVYWTDGTSLHVTFPDITSVCAQNSVIDMELRERGWHGRRRTAPKFMPDFLADHLSLRHRAPRPTWTMEFTVVDLPHAKAFREGYMSYYGNLRPWSFEDFNVEVGGAEPDPQLLKLAEVADGVPVSLKSDLEESNSGTYNAREMVARFKLATQMSLAGVMHESGMPVLYSNVAKIAQWGEEIVTNVWAVEPDAGLKPAIVPVATCLKNYGVIANQMTLRSMVDAGYKAFDRVQLGEIADHLNTKQMAWGLVQEGLLSSWDDDVRENWKRLQPWSVRGMRGMEVEQFSQLLETAIGNRRVGYVMAAEIKRRAECNLLTQQEMRQLLDGDIRGEAAGELKEYLRGRL